MEALYFKTIDFILDVCNTRAFFEVVAVISAFTIGVIVG